MFKFIFFLIIVGLLYNEFSYVFTNTNDIHKSIHIKIPHLPIIKEHNISTTIDFFNPQIWLLSQADKNSLKNDQKHKAIDINKTDILQIIATKQESTLCKGTYCLTIKGVLNQTLLLEEANGKTLILKPNQSIFNNIIFKGIQNTTLFFENNETNKTYHLRFFAYTLPTFDNNKTNNIQQRQKDNR